MWRGTRKTGDDVPWREQGLFERLKSRLSPKLSDQIRASMAKNIQLGKFRMLVVVFHDELWPFSTAPNDSKGAKMTYN
jgi:hypothetical protein